MAKATCMKNYEFKVRNMLAQIALFGTMLCAPAYRIGGVQATSGLLIGLVTGAFYFLYLYRQVENVQVFSVKQAVEHIRGGWIIRLGAMVLILIVVNHVLKGSGLSFVAGFFVTPVLLFMNGMILVAKQIVDAKRL